MKQNQAYYLSLDGGPDNIVSTQRELLINSCGLAVLPLEFQTWQRGGRQDFYLQYMIAGEMDVWFDDIHEVQSPGQAIVYYPHTPYRYGMRGQAPVLYYWVHFTGARAAELVEKFQIPNQTILGIGQDEIVENHFQEIFREFITREPPFFFATTSRLIAIFQVIFQKTTSLLQQGGASSRVLSRSLTYIHTNYHKPLTVKQLADLEHLSVSRYRHVFRTHTGLSPLSYVVALRINQARQLLVQTDLPIHQIALQVGYQDPLYFSRLFKKRTEQTPTQYRDAFGE